LTNQRDLSSLEGISGNMDAEDGEFAPVWLRKSLALARRRFLLVVSVAVVGASFATILASSAPLKFQSSVRIYVTDAAGRPGQLVPLYSALAAGNREELLLSIEVLRAVVVGEEIAQLPEFVSESESWLGDRLSGMKRLISEVFGNSSGEDRHRVQESSPVREPTETLLIQGLSEVTQVSVPGGRNIVEISVAANSPDTAQRLAASVGNAFIAERDRQQKARLSEEVRLHSERVVQLHSEVAQAENTLAEYVASNDMDNLETRSAQIGLRTANLNFEIVRLQVELAKLRSARDRIRTTVTENLDLGSLPEVQTSELAASLRSEQLAMKRKLTELQQSNIPKAEIDTLELQVAEFDRQLSEETQRIVDSLGNQISGIETSERQLQSGLSELVAETEAIQAALIVIDDLQRKVDASREVYVAFLSGSDPNYDYETRFVSDGWVVQPASQPMEPVTGPMRMIAMAGGLAGATLGMLLALFRDRLIRGFVAAGQIEKVLRLPVLISLPRAETRKRRWFRKRSDSRSGLPQQVAEELRNFRHRLTGNFGARFAPVVLLTSMGSEEGRTGFAATLAKTAEQDGRSVLLIDADLKYAGLSKAMNFEYSDGLTELVEAASWDLEGISPRSSILDILPAGCIIDEPLKFIESPTFARFLDEARDHYDLILIDGPSNMSSLETRVLAGLCDANCLVVRWNFTPREDILDAVERLGREKFLGVVFTEVDPKNAALYHATYPRRQSRSAANRGGLAGCAPLLGPVAIAGVPNCV
jgi:succinoglycan biosynthesis transport protein ExoP